MHRLFVALTLPAAVRDLLLDTMDGAELKWQAEEQLHLTLRFVGEVELPLAEDLADALHGLAFPAFPLQLRGVGRFDHGRRGALWAGVAPSEPLRTLAAKVERACQRSGLGPERRAFHPHVTLARWSGGRPPIEAWMARHSAIASDAWTVRDFTLFESHLGRSGAHYEPVETYPLLPSAAGEPISPTSR